MGQMAPLFMGTAATAGGAAATAGLFGVGGAFSLAATLGTIGSVLGIVGLFSSHRQQVQAGNFQAIDTVQTANLLDLSGLQEGVRGLQEKVNIADEERRRQARIRATYAARGITLDGSPETVMNDSLTQSRRQYLAADFNADTASFEKAARAEIARHLARNQRATGLATATSNTISGAADLFASVNR